MRRLVWPLLLSLALVLAACGGGDEGELSVDDLEPDATEAPEDGDDDAEDDPGDDAGDEDDEGNDEPAPEPDPARVEDPCAGQDEVTLDVAAPVDGQEVAEEFDLVGCARVPEGTVRYRLTADGETLLDDFTTAECGGPCTGEFRTTVGLEDVEATGEATLEVFWDSPSDGGEEDTSEIGLVLQ